MALATLLAVVTLPALAVVTLPALALAILLTLATIHQRRAEASVDRPVMLQVYHREVSVERTSWACPLRSWHRS